MTTLMPSREWSPAIQLAAVLESEEAKAVAERFVAGFESYLSEQKQKAVRAVLQAEMPYLATDEDFIQRVTARLQNEDLFASSRFIFLSKNPKYFG